MTDENREQLRDEILSTTAADFKRFREALVSLRENGQVVVLGSAAAIKAANDERGGDWLEVHQVL